MQKIEYVYRDEDIPRAKQQMFDNLCQVMLDEGCSIALEKVNTMILVMQHNDPDLLEECLSVINKYKDVTEHLSVPQIEAFKKMVRIIEKAIDEVKECGEIDTRRTV